MEGRTAGGGLEKTYKLPPATWGGEVARHARMWGGYLKCVCALVYLVDESSELQSRPRFYSNSFRVFTWDAPSICVLECPLLRFG